MVRHPPKSGAKPRAGQAEKKPLRTERIAKVLARAGVASRREVERLIGLGLVAVNGRVLDTPATLVTRDDIVTVEGHVVGAAEATRVWRYHKPVGLMTTHKDPGGRETVFETLPEDMPRVISVGRLDINSEGLLLLTNDGELARELELPKNAWRRVYRARALGKITQAKLDTLADGITVEGVNYGAIEARLDKAKEKGDGRANVWITLTLNEGKNREVRRVLEALGLKVNRLLRLAYGPFQLGDLGVGEIEEVGPRVIREQLADFIEEGNLPTGDRTLSAPAATGRRPGSALADPRKKPSRVREEEEREAAEGPREPRVAKRSFGDKAEKAAFGERKPPRAGAGKGFSDKKPFADKKSFRDKPFGDKPPRAKSSFDGAEKGAFGDRKPPRAGAGKSFSDKKPFADKKTFGDKAEKGAFGARKSAPASDSKGFGASKAFEDKKSKSFSKNKAVRATGASRGFSGARTSGDRDDRPKRTFDDKPARSGAFGSGAAKPRGEDRGYARDDKPARGGGGSFGDKPARSGGFGSGEGRPARASRAEGPRSDDRPSRGGGFGDKRSAAPRGGPRKSFDRDDGKPARGAKGFGDGKPPRASARSNADKPARSGGFGAGDSKPARGAAFERPERARPPGRTTVAKSGFRSDGPPSKGPRAGAKTGGFKGKPGAAPRGAKPGGKPAPRGDKPAARTGAKRPPSRGPAGPRGPKRD